jgi:tetratricopeptide (TPR) repeat protein
MKLYPVVRRILFSIIAIALPFVLVGLVELVLRLAGYGNDYPLFVEDPVNTELLRVNPEIAQRYFLNPEGAPEVSFPPFRKEKNEHTLRIVVQGASTALGIPYMHGGSFPAMLEQRLRASCPDREVEVINTAITAVNSYTLLDLGDEITDIQPDAVLIYAGHNEYYGALGVASTQMLSRAAGIKYLYMVLDDFRLFQVVRNIQKKAARKRSGDILLSPDKTLMERMVSKQSIPLGSELYYAGIRQFDRNLKRLISIYQKKGIPVLIGTTVCNLKDQEPFISQDTADSLSAKAHYLAGQVYLSDDRPDEALEMFSMARDLDQLRFRSPGQINEIIRQYAGQEGIKVVDMDSVFRLHSANGITGKELLTEHVHPNARGYFLMADAFYNVLNTNPFFNCDLAISPGEAYDMMPVTSVDSVFAHLGISLLTSSWPFRDEPAGKEAVLSSFKAVSPADSLGFQVFNESLTWTEAQNQYYRFCMQEENFREAIRTAEALKLEFRYSGIPYNMAARAYGMLNRTDMSIRELERGYQTEPLPEMAYNLSTYYLSQGRLEESHQFLDRAIQTSTSFDHAKERLQILRESIEMKTQLITDSANVNLMMSLAQHYIRLNQTAEANTLIRRAIITDPSHPEVQQLLSRLRNQ